MARKLRVEYPGAVYHVMSRGDRREAIFSDDEDRQRFLECLAEACQKTGWQVHAYCLMPDHFHLVLETPRGNLVAGMKWFLGTYTGRFNRRHRVFGHLFGGRYKALMVDGSGDGYLKTVCDYAHLNPARDGFLKGKQKLADFPWSSFPWYLRDASERPKWLRVDRLLGEWRIPKDSEAGRRAFEEGMEERRREKPGAEFKGVERGWYLGDEAFRQELLKRVTVGRGPSHYGEAVKEGAEVGAEGKVAAGLKGLGWTEEDLAKRRKGDAGKVRLAAELRGTTTMTVAWIAERLKMGTAGYLACLLCAAKQNREKEIVQNG